ncbi:hypothetical protein CGCTS75_v008446 [Colletotrichum tropicale]|nr:hypothetical protein CGCTS75_v008446 [Colletotrichum tropicale]
MKRSQLNKAIASIEKDNDRLGKLLDTKTKANYMNKSNGLYSKVDVKFVAPLPKIRDNAARVHESLRTRFCADHECHEAGLLLQQRIRRRRDLSQQEILRNVGTPECFCVSMRFSEMSWIDTEIRVYDESSTSTSQTGSSVSRMVTTGPNIQTTLNTSVPVLETLAINDICTAIHGAMYPQIGLKIDQAGILRGLFEVETRQYHLAANMVTMDDFLPVIHRRDHSMPDLYYLALTLVSSVLQLGETPWLIHSWSRQRIAFLRLEDGSQSSVDIKHPYYLASHYDSDTVVPQHEAKTAALRLRNRRTLLALAIMLLELNFGTPVEDIRTESDMGPDRRPHEQTDLLTAQRWFIQKERKGQLTRGFKSAIWHCLQCSTHYAASFDNDKFVQTIQEKVLGPIEQEFLGTWVDF